MTEKNKLIQELTKQFWERIDERIGGEHKVNPVLYHYTGLNSLMGMTETNKLWLSKGTFLNDRKELVYIADTVRSILDRMNRTLIEKYGEDKKVKEIKDVFLQKLNQNLLKFQEEIDLGGFEAYIFSLTENKDSLALWYNYSSGDGYNIGFSSKQLLERIYDFSEHTKNSCNLVYGRVIYDKETQENLLMEFFMDAADYLFKHKEAVELDEFSKPLSDHLFSIIAICSIFFKNEAFKSEEEFRVAFPRAIDNNNKLDVHFRAQNGLIIPFITVDFDSRLPISHVTIGPKNNIDVAKAGIEHYLKSKGHDMEKITVSKSVAELRY